MHYDGIVPAKDILLITSHVVHGHVGSDAVQFPLNLRNWNTDAIETTNLSNHPGHRTFQKGNIVGVKKMWNGLQNIGMKYDVVLVGYLGTTQNLHDAMDILKNIQKNEGNDCMIVVDPIMGDNGKVYVEKGIVDGFQDMIKWAKIGLLAPNSFEFELLSGKEVNDASLLAFWETHDIQNVVITSVMKNGKMFCVGIDTNGVIFWEEVGIVDNVFSGAGDLFLGILVDEMTRCGRLQEAVRSSIGVVGQVLKVSGAGKTGYVPDLKIIECKQLIER